MGEALPTISNHFLRGNTMANTTTTTTTTTTTLAARAAGLLSKSTALAVAEKAIGQAVAAKRVFPPMAADFAEQLGVELPLKTRDFVRVVGFLLSASEKPIKGVVSKKKGEILAVLADLVGSLTDTAPVSLPAWAMPKERAKKDETVDASGALERANAEAVANEAAEELAEAARAEKGAAALARAVALVVANAAALTNDQREALTLALASIEPAI